jgi:hypothetical protein
MLECLEGFQQVDLDVHCVRRAYVTIEAYNFVKNVHNFVGMDWGELSCFVFEVTSISTVCRLHATTSRIRHVHSLSFHPC